MLCKRLSEHLDDVMTFGVGCTKALRPSNEGTVVDPVLSAQRQSSCIVEASRYLRARVRELQHDSVRPLIGRCRTYREA